jgi:hypothetical protein
MDEIDALEMEVLRRDPALTASDNESPPDNFSKRHPPPIEWAEKT